MEKYISVVEKARTFIKDPLLLNSQMPTHAIHSGHVPFEHPGTGHPIIPPIALSTTFAQKSPNCPLKYDYSRAGNYNREILEKTLAAMENGKYCSIFSSGLATVSSITQLFKCGDHILFFTSAFRGTKEYLSQIASKLGIEYDPVDMQDLDLFKSALKPNTKMVWLESPSNPLMRIVDIKQISAISKRHNENIIVVVDNTFLTPVFQLPLSLGADIVLHSLTKYLNGHSDVLMGAAITNNTSVSQALKEQQSMVGAVPSSFDCYMALRGLRTLSLRMMHHQLSGLAIAIFLSDHPKIEKVLHPALFLSPEKELISQQMSGFSGMLSFVMKGTIQDLTTFIQNLKYFYLGESLGGFESLIEYPSLMSYAAYSEDQRKALGIPDNLLRISVGLEDIFTLLSDIDQALDKVK